MKTRDLIDMLVLAAVWGASFLFLRIASPALGPVVVAAGRVSGAALILLPLVFMRGQAHEWKGRIKPLIITALLSSVLPFLGLSQASRSLPAGLLSILNATTPIWGALVGWVWVREPLPPARVVGLAVGFMGVIWLISQSADVNLAGGGLAVGLALGSTLMYAVAMHYNKQRLQGMGALSTSAGTLTMAALMLAGPAWLTGPSPSDVAASTSWQAVPTSAWLSLLALALVCTGLAYLLFYRLIDRIGPSRAMTVTFLIPAFGMLWSALFLHEAVTAPMLLSTAAIVVGTWLANRAAQGTGPQSKNP